MKRTLRFLLVPVMLVTTFFAISTAAAPEASATTTTVVNATTHPDNWMWGGTGLPAQVRYCHKDVWELDNYDDNVKFVWQGIDCNYVLYVKGIPVWASNTANQVGTGGYLKFWKDGGIGIYKANGQRLWAIFSTGGTLPAGFQFLPTRCNGKAGFASFSIANDFTPSYSWDPRQLYCNPIYS